MPAAAASQDTLPAASQTWTPNKDEQDDLAALNATLSRLRTATASDPYVLTIPQDVEPRYHHQHKAWGEQWMSNAPFERGEHESLQYQTFFFHEHGRDMYVLQNSRPPAAEEPRVNGGTRPRSTTGANTPNTAPKKKITLGAYKKAKTGATGTPERDAPKDSNAPVKQAALKGPVERVRAETEEMLAAVAEDKEPTPIVESKARNEKRDLKRKREDAAPQETKKGLPSKQVDTTAARNISAEPAAKKPKVSNIDAPSSGHAKKQSVSNAVALEKKAQQPELVNKGMPPRLSPGMPPRLSPGLPEKLSPLQKTDDSTPRKSTAHANGPEEMQGLPPRLSPTLPENIARALETRTNSQSTPMSLNPTSAPGSAIKNREEKLTPSKKPDGVTKRKSPIPLNGFRATSGSPAVPPDPEDKPNPSFPVPRPKTAAPSRDETIAVGKASNASNGQKSDQDNRECYMVKFKLSRSRREAASRILKLPPRPARSIPSQPTPPPPPPEETKQPSKSGEKRNGERKETGPVKGVAQKIGPIKREKKPKPPQEDKPAVAEKRPASEDGNITSPTKRKKTDVPEARKEPATPAQRELDSPLAPKSAQQATPGVRKDLLSAAMRREQSQDSIATHNTPPELSNTPSINNSSSQTHGAARPPSSQPNSTTPKQHAWEAEQRRLETLGREIKHAASAHLNASQQDSSNKLVEQRMAAVKCMESFLCYLVAFTCADEAASAAEPKQTPPYKLWRSLSGFFGFVKKTTEPFGPLSGLACTLGMVFNARILAIVTQFPGDGPSRNELLETQAQLQRSANDAETKLDIDMLQDNFPRSWKERTKRTNLGNEKLDPVQLGGMYKLPIGVSTSPIRAARAGHAMLYEWMESQKISYNLKLKL